MNLWNLSKRDQRMSVSAYSKTSAIASGEGFLLLLRVAILSAVLAAAILPVCPSHASIVSKRMNVERCRLQSGKLTDSSFW